MKEPKPKIKRCKTCGGSFVAEPQFEYNNKGDDKFDGYLDDCEICIMRRNKPRINDEILNQIINYQEGLLTVKELVKNISEIKI